VSVRLTRRRLLAAAAGLALGGGSVAELDRLLSGGSSPVALGAEPPNLPERQHAWEASLATDAHGNAVAPLHDRLLLFDLNGRPTTEKATRLEAALRTLERRFARGHDGLLFTIGWGPAYFAAIGRPSPVPPPRALSSFELPTLDRYAACLHLAADDESRLDTVARALTAGALLPGADGPVDLRSAFRLRETRTGFAGAGLPARHQAVGGIPAGHPVPADSPLFMGFKSAYRRNQASEDDVTIDSGAFAGGTTMHVSRMRLRLDSWYALGPEQRVARMFAPQVTARDVARFTTDAPSHPAGLDRAASRYGVVGHSQTSARARRDGRPVILRRDFDTVDGGEAGLHFVCLQRTVQDFVDTRQAMNAARATYANPAITATDNNGINEFIFVLNRANYVLPPRRLRAFPLL
jgi:dye decolorizing peroxidase